MLVVLTGQLFLSGRSEEIGRDAVKGLHDEAITSRRSQGKNEEVTSRVVRVMDRNQDEDFVEGDQVGDEMVSKKVCRTQVSDDAYQDYVAEVRELEQEQQKLYLTLQALPPDERKSRWAQYQASNLARKIALEKVEQQLITEEDYPERFR